MGFLVDGKGTGLKYVIRKAEGLKNTWYVWLYLDGKPVAPAKSFHTWGAALWHAIN